MLAFSAIVKKCHAQIRQHKHKHHDRYLNEQPVCRDISQTKQIRQKVQRRKTHIRNAPCLWLFAEDMQEQYVQHSENEPV